MSDGRGLRSGELRAVLLGEHKGLARFRNNLKHLPTDPRCKLCAAPFAGPGGAVLRHFGFGRRPGQSRALPQLHPQFQQDRGDGCGDPGHAPVRRYPRLDGARRAAHADRVPRLSRGVLPDRVARDPRPRRPGRQAGGRRDHRPVLRRRQRTAPCSGWPRRGDRPRVARAAEPTRRRKARSRSAPRSIPATPTSARPARRTRSRTSRPWATSVNTTARLASAAGAGELFVSVAAAEAAGDVPPDAERRTLEVRGREATIDVIVLRPAA